MSINVTGAVTADTITVDTVTADTVVADSFAGAVIQATTDYAADGAIDPSILSATLSKAGASAMTLAAPGAANAGKTLRVVAASAQAHVITAASVSGGNTLTFGGAIGDSVVLFGLSATAWSIDGTTNVTLSTV